ncbi:MAG: DUF87 domain-containing protein [Nanoarchaeota archaeon]|nr:DUF87 domain-containing protein [Nanoarchaeota archaeon]
MDKIKVSIGKSNGEDVDIDAQKIVTGRTCVIAQSGAGKSYLIAVLCEQFLKHNIPFCIIDTEGEYFSLREKYNILWIGGNKSDLKIENTDFKKLALKIINERIPLILDVSDVNDERKVVSDFLKELYEVADELRTPYLLMIEEADKFIPQSKESMPQIEEISRRGRKRGLGLLLASQRPALVNKNVLSQCGNQMIGKLTTENDLQAVNLFFGSRKELEELPELEPGEFFIMGDVSKKSKTKIKERETKHKGLTPILIPKSVGKISVNDLKKRSETIDIDMPKEKEVDISAVEPKLNREQIMQLAKDKAGKKYILFGKNIDVKYIELEMKPLVYIEYKQPEGLVNKKHKKYSFILDGLTGDMITVSKGLHYQNGFRDIIGLTDSEVKVLMNVSKDSTVDDIKDRTRISEKNIKSVLTSLQKKNLVDHSNKKYSLLSHIKMPNIKQTQLFPASEITLSGKMVKSRLLEKDIINILKAINHKIEVMKFELFYYPIYTIYFSNRIVSIDGITGKEV